MINNITAIILAGGRAKRMQEKDKGLMQLMQRPMIEHVLNIIKPQVEKIIINANRNHSIYAQYGFPIVADQAKNYCGPLAGIASGLQASTTDYVVTVPCDSPFIPDNLVQKLYTRLANENAEICSVHCNDRLQPVFTLIRSQLLPSILDSLNCGEYKIDRWFAKHDLAIADFSDQADCFSNINSLEELKKFEQQMQKA